MKLRIQGIIIGFIMAIFMFVGLAIINSYYNTGFDHISSSRLQDSIFPDLDAPLNNVSKIYTGVPLAVPSTEREVTYYAEFNISYDEYKKGYCYNGKLVGLFIDRCRNGQGVVFLNDSGEVNIKIGRDVAGKMTGVKILSDDVDLEMDRYFSNQRG